MADIISRSHGGDGGVEDPRRLRENRTQYEEGKYCIFNVYS